MKKYLILVMLPVLFLFGCGKNSGEIGGAIAMRQRLLSGNGCAFTATVTADYGDKVYAFSMACKADKVGDMTFAVIAPELIAGISGKITEIGGHLTFDDKALAFAPIADGQVTPVTAPWLLLKTLRSGYISACGKDGEQIYMQIDDSYAEQALHLDIWTDKSFLPVRGEVLWMGKRILTISVEDFKIL